MTSVARSASHRFAGLALALILCRPATAAALEVIAVDVSYGTDGFHVALDARLDAPTSSVERVLRDYADYPALDERVKESRVLERLDDRTVLLYTRLRACAGIFCRSVRRVERIEHRPHELIALTIAERSDLHHGLVHTVLTSEGKATRVMYRSSFEPDFWVPRFIATGLALRTLEAATLALFTKIESVARDRGRS